MKESTKQPESEESRDSDEGHQRSRQGDEQVESAQQLDAGSQDAQPDEARAVAESQSSAAQVDQQLEELRNEVKSLRDKHLRALADYQNLQKRAAVQQAEAARYGQAELVRSLLVVLDDFERTLEAAKSATDVTAVTEGVRIIYDHMLKILGNFGVEQVLVGKGEPFDPIYQEAVAQQTSAEVPAGHVLQLAQVGYKMGDRVLRPAKVVVVVEPVSEPEQGSDSAEPSKKPGQPTEQSAEDEASDEPP